jgi:hypothetical protein
MARKKKRKFIDGIYNYCDRWCERCAFTERCRVYDMEQKAFANEESRDPENAAFWEAMTGILEQTKQMLRATAAERGIDLDQIDLDDGGASERRRKRVRSNPLARAGEKYAAVVSKWFEVQERLFADCQEGLNERLQMDLPGDDPAGEAVALTDAADVIRWYQFQIAVKLMRALGQDVDDDEEVDEELQEIHAHDRDGSAKVALIGIDRSLAAWSVLRQSLDDEADSILDILLGLSRLRVAAERAFPNSRAFIRPGFDAPVEP